MENAKSKANEIINELKKHSNPEAVKGMAKFGMTNNKRLGVSVPVMRKIAKDTGKDHNLALSLWKEGYPETRIVAALVGEPDKLTEAQMEDWVKDFDSWDVCDQVCMNLFDRTPLAWKKVIDWSKRDEEFVKRAAYALIACLAWHDKEADDKRFIEQFSVIIDGSTDNRNFVKKAVSWALRHIGKRNIGLNKEAIKCAKEIKKKDSKGSQWVAKDVLRELESENIQLRLIKQSK